MINVIIKASIIGGRFWDIPSKGKRCIRCWKIPIATPTCLTSTMKCASKCPPSVWVQCTAICRNFVVADVSNVWVWKIRQSVLTPTWTITLILSAPLAEMCTTSIVRLHTSSAVAAMCNARKWYCTALATNVSGLSRIKIKKESRSMKKWVCTVCGYVHEGDQPPEVCPLCGVDSSNFEEVTE